MDTSEILNSASDEINDKMCSKSSSCLISNAIKEDAYVQLGDHKLKFEHTEFDAEDKEKARKELRETPEIVAEALEEFRRLLKNEPLNYPTDEDDKLKVFLRPCKYYPESALARMKTFYKYKVKHPKYYENLVPSKETKAFYQSLINALPQRGENGERILIVEAGRKWNTKACTLNDILRSVMLILEAALAEPRTQISGVHVILDMAGLSLQHVWQFTPVFAKNVVDWVQDCIPIRLKGIHIVNQPYIFNMVFALFKPFLGEKLQNRIHFHGSNFDALHNFITPKILPAQFGGNGNMPMDKGEELHRYLMLYEEDLTLKGQEGYASAKDCD